MPGLIGANTVRTDGMVKATGEAVFTVDYAELGMLHGRLLRSPVAAGQILKLDTSKALAMRGVRAIIAHKDVQGGLVGLILKDRGLFADKVVRFVGEPHRPHALEMPLRILLTDAAHSILSSENLFSE